MGEGGAGSFIIFDCSLDFGNDETTALQDWLRTILMEEPTFKAKISLNSLYDRYKADFCRRGLSSLNPRRKSELGKAVRKTFPRVKKRRLGPIGSQEAYYGGVTWLRTKVVTNIKTKRPKTSSSKKEEIVIEDQEYVQEITIDWTLELLKGRDADIMEDLSNKKLDVSEQEEDRPKTGEQSLRFLAVEWDLELVKRVRNYVTRSKPLASSSERTWGRDQGDELRVMDGFFLGP